MAVAYAVRAVHFQSDLLVLLLSLKMATEDYIEELHAVLRKHSDSEQRIYYLKGRV